MPGGVQVTLSTAVARRQREQHRPCTVGPRFGPGLRDKVLHTRSRAGGSGAAAPRSPRPWQTPLRSERRGVHAVHLVGEEDLPIGRAQPGQAPHRRAATLSSLRRRHTSSRLPDSPGSTRRWALRRARSSRCARDAIRSRAVTTAYGASASPSTRSSAQPSPGPMSPARDPRPGGHLGSEHRPLGGSARVQDRLLGPGFRARRPAPPR